MENIKYIIKQTLLSLKDKEQIASPENYFIEFKYFAEKNNFQIKDIELFNSLIVSLTPREKENKIKSFSELSNILSKRPKNCNLKNLIAVLDEILAPSIDFSIVEDIDNFIIEIIKTPEKLLERESIHKIKEIKKKRVNNDRDILLKKTNDIIKLTSLMNKYFEKTILSNSVSNDELHVIKDELASLNISNASKRELSSVQTKLIDTVHSIEEVMVNSSKEITSQKKNYNQLHETIKVLQKKLDIAKKEKSIDFLTNIMNRRAFKEEVEKIEKKYNIFNITYAIVFYDIDHFKKINDTYGHICGDAVLRTIGGILKNLTRREDIIARYGGEEFIALIHYENEGELQKYIKRVKSLIDKSNFNYKEYDLTVKISAGVSFRSKYDSYMDTKKMADELLYKAKDNGRDKVFFDNGLVI